MDLTIRNANPSDARSIADIYNHYILNTHITFETEVVEAEEIDERIKSIVDGSLPWLVAQSSDEILGYAYASSWKQRKAYEHTVESTIYISHNHVNLGIGKPLYQALIGALRASEMHSAIGGIALPNKASVRFHEHFGFEKVGHLERVGFKHDQWIDVGYWQLML